MRFISTIILHYDIIASNMAGGANMGNDNTFSLKSILFAWAIAIVIVVSLFAGFMVSKYFLIITLVCEIVYNAFCMRSFRCHSCGKTLALLVITSAIHHPISCHHCNARIEVK